VVVEISGAPASDGDGVQWHVSAEQREREGRAAGGEEGSARWLYSCRRARERASGRRNGVAQVLTFINGSQRLEKKRTGGSIHLSRVWMTRCRRTGPFTLARQDTGLFHVSVDAANVLQNNLPRVHFLAPLRR
jgi:hypothetical protein